MSARGFLGAGDLYLAIMVNGVFQNYEGPFECTKFEIKPKVDLKEMKSKGRATYGQVIETAAIAQPSDFTVELAEVNKQSLALALLGTTAGMTQAAGSLIDEAVVAKLGYWVPLSKLYVTEATVVVTNNAGTTTYVNGVDYLINPRMGWIKALKTGAIADLSTIKVDYSYGTVAGTEIKGSTQAQLRAKFKLDGKNFADDTDVIVTVHEAVIAADSAFDFLGNDFNTVTLPGRMKTPTGYIEPFTVHLPQQA